MPPRTSELRHYHQRSQQFFFILSGKVTLEIGGYRQVIFKHEGVEVSPHVAHQIFNEGDRN